VLTFVVRVWTPGEGADVEPELRGVVADVRTGEEQVFTGDAELLDVIRRARGAPLPSPPIPPLSP
jgi:hypothetical protein